MRLLFADTMPGARLRTLPPLLDTGAVAIAQSGRAESRAAKPNRECGTKTQRTILAGCGKKTSYAPTEIRAFRTLGKRWPLSLTSLPPGETRVREQAAEIAFFRGLLEHFDEIS